MRSAPPAAEALVIAIGGAIGTSLRFAVALGMQAGHQHSAWATTAANLVGAFLLGVILARAEFTATHPLLRPFLVVGVFGSFTTFSALAFDNRLLATEHGEAVALLHLFGSIAIGIVAFVGGATIAGGRR